MFIFGNVIVHLKKESNPVVIYRIKGPFTLCDNAYNCDWL